MKLNKNIRILLFFIIVLFSCFVLCRNYVFQKNDFINTVDFNNGVLANYTYNGATYIPNDDSAALYLDFGDAIELNSVSLGLEEGLEENASISFYVITSDSDTMLLEQKTVRSGYKHINFNFERQNVRGIKIVFQSLDGTHIINISNGYVEMSCKSYDYFQKNTIYIVSIVVMIIVSMLVTFGISHFTNGFYSMSNRQTRDSNIELLRIICMVLLVGHHFSVHGGLLGLNFSSSMMAGLALLPVGKICFIAFIAISMYFLVDGSYKPDRFLNCWIEVLFYSILLTMLTYAMGGVVRFRDAVSCLFVMIGNSHGFAASYLLFLLIYPFLLAITKNCSKNKARLLLLIAFNVQIFSQILKGWTGYNQPVYSELGLFIFCFFLSLNLKRYPIELLNNKVFDMIVVIAVYSYVYVIDYVAYKGELNSCSSVMYSITGDESSIFFIIGGYALFYLFKNIHIPHVSAINSIATTTFGVLLIHDHNFFRHLFWNEIVRTQTFYNSEHFILYLMIATVMIFIICSLIDYIRFIIFSNVFYKTKMYMRIREFLNEIYE